MKNFKGLKESVYWVNQMKESKYVWVQSMYYTCPTCNQDADNIQCPLILCFSNTLKLHSPKFFLEFNSVESLKKFLGQLNLKLSKNLERDKLFSLNKEIQFSKEKT